MLIDMHLVGLLCMVYLTLILGAMRECVIDHGGNELDHTLIEFLKFAEFALIAKGVRNGEQLIIDDP